MLARLCMVMVLAAGCLVPPEAPPASPTGAPATFTYVPPGREDPVVARLVAEEPTLVAAAPHAEVESAVAVDPTNESHVVAFHIERTQKYLTGSGLLEPRRPGLIAESLVTSWDGGQTWTTRRLPHAGTAELDSKWGAYCTLADPNVFFDRDGLVHVITLAVGCSAPGYLLAGTAAVIHATTADDGATWSEPDIIWVSAGGSAVWINDRQWSAYDAGSGRMIASWSMFLGFLARTSLVVSISEDGGTTWTMPEELEVALGPAGHNWLVHAAYGADGIARIATHGAADGRTLGVFRSAGEGGWERTEVPMCKGAPAEGFYDYPTLAPGQTHPDVLAAGVFTAAGPAGVCVLLLSGRVEEERWIPHAEHPWVERTADGTVALAHLHNHDKRVTPTLTLLAASHLSVLASVPLGEAYDPDVEDDGIRETSHYDTMARSGSTFIWTLTRPNGEGRPFDGATVDMDIWAYRARIDGLAW